MPYTALLKGIRNALPFVSIGKEQAVGSADCPIGNGFDLLARHGRKNNQIRTEPLPRDLGAPQDKTKNKNRIKMSGER